MIRPGSLARIYAPPRSSMTSGTARTTGWVLDYEPAEAKRIDPLTGWFGSGDMQAQVRLFFPTRAEAVAYAEANAIPYEVEEAKPHVVKPKSYADNFRYGRPENWTH